MSSYLSVSYFDNNSFIISAQLQAQKRLARNQGPYYGGSLPDVNQIGRNHQDFQVTDLHHSQLLAWGDKGLHWHCVWIMQQRCLYHHISNPFSFSLTLCLCLFLSLSPPPPPFSLFLFLSLCLSLSPPSLTLSASISPSQGSFSSTLESSRSTRHHGLVERVQRDRRFVSPVRPYRNRQVSFSQPIRCCGTWSLCFPTCGSGPYLGSPLCIWGHGRLMSYRYLTIHFW